MRESREKRKALVDAYMERTVTGGVYRIVNRENGKFLVCSSVDMEGAKNRFVFSVSTGGCSVIRLRDDWAEFGPQVFAFEVLETIDRKPDQEARQFAEDVAMLEEIWREKLDMTLSYEQKASPV